MKELTTVPIIVLFFILFGCGTASSLNTTGEKKSKPNIIFILTEFEYSSERIELHLLKIQILHGFFRLIAADKAI